MKLLDAVHSDAGTFHSCAAAAISISRAVAPALRRYSWELRMVRLPTAADRTRLLQELPARRFEFAGECPGHGRPLCLRRLQGLRRGVDRRADARIGSAAADIGHRRVDVLVAGVAILCEQGDRRHDLS